LKPIKEFSGSLNTGPPAPLVLLTPVILLLVYTSFKNYLLFHSIIELWSIIVALSIFLIALNTYPISPNRFFVFLGLAYGFIGIMDLLHTLAYQGMGVFPGYDANISTQLWIAARRMEFCGI